MKLRDLEYLVAVYETGGFSKAAERCFVSQPTLSGQLKKLEELLGAPLIERSTRSILFTPLGEKVVAKAREVLANIKDIEDLVNVEGGAYSGDFHLGLIPTIGPYLLPKIVSTLTQAYPNLNFYLHELQTEQLLAKLSDGELDAGILAKVEDHPELYQQHLYFEDLLLAVPTDDELAQKSQRLSMNSLEGRELLMLEDGHCLRDQTLGFCFSAGAQEDQRFQATSMSTLMHMVLTGCGITLVPRLAADNAPEGLECIEFEPPKPHREVTMITRIKAARRPEVEGIANFISLQATDWFE